MATHSADDGGARPLMMLPACSDGTTPSKAIDAAGPIVEQEAQWPDSNAIAIEPARLSVDETTGVLASSSSTSPSTAPAPPEGGLPGEAVDEGSVPFLPRAGAMLTVLGIAHDDVLNVRVRPGGDQPIVTTLGPIEDGIKAAGRHRRLADGSIWSEIEARGQTGWANSRLLIYLGPTFDATSQVVRLNDGYPTAPSIEELGRLVADLFSDPEGSSVVMAVAPSMADLGEVTYEVIGLGDDSVWGVRVHVFAAPPGDSDLGYSLKSVELTDLCMRGGSPDGLCV